MGLSGGSDLQLRFRKPSELDEQRRSSISIHRRRKPLAQCLFDDRTDALDRLVLTTYPTAPATSGSTMYDFRGDVINSTDQAGDDGANGCMSALLNNCSFRVFTPPCPYGRKSALIVRRSSMAA